MLTYLFNIFLYEYEARNPTPGVLVRNKELFCEVKRDWWLYFNTEYLVKDKTERLQKQNCGTCNVDWTQCMYFYVLYRCAAHLGPLYVVMLIFVFGMNN